MGAAQIRVMSMGINDNRERRFIWHPLFSAPGAATVSRSVGRISERVQEASFCNQQLCDDRNAGKICFRAKATSGAGPNILAKLSGSPMDICRDVSKRSRSGAVAGELRQVFFEFADELPGR